MKRRTGRARLGLAVVATWAAAALLAGEARGDSIAIFGDMDNSTENLGDFTGTIDYSFDGSVGNLIISLTNTTDPLIGGFLTGFLFNVNADDADATLVDTTNNAFKDTGGGDGAPYGDFDAGAALGGAFLGGGSPVKGIAVGETDIFTFEVNGSDASSLSAISFVTGPNEFNFITRFKGMANDESDKVPAFIPLPAPVALGAVGLLGVFAGSRRRRAARAD